MGNTPTKEQFADAIDRISKDDIPPDATEFWDSLWRIPSTSYEIFELITPDDLRIWLKTRPGNVATLFTQGVAQLCQVVETPNPGYFGQALTCIRMLTRLMPFLIEIQNDEFVEQLFWGTNITVGGAQNQGQEEEETSEPLATMLIRSIYGLLFLPKFTIPERKVSDDDVVDPVFGHPELIWKSGIGRDSIPSSSSKSMDSNRIEVLRLMITCLCDPLFQSPENYDPFKGRLQQIATSALEPLVPSLFCSLLNSVIAFDPYGWGIPYGSQLVDDTPQKLLEISAQALVALLDFGLPAGQEELHPRDGSSVPEGREDVNAYRTLVMQLKDHKHFDDIFFGLTRLLNNVHEAENVYLPGSYYKIECHQELLILVWKILEENDKFQSYAMKYCDITRLVVPVCFLMFEARQLESKVSLVHICTFLLLKLSGDRSLGVLLNKTYDLRLPMELPIFTGNYADFLIISLQKIVVTGIDKLSSLYHCFLTIICNISPYCKSLSLVSSVKLVNLFETFASPKFFFSSESNHMFVSLLLEIFNNLIQYQYAGNPHLVYAIIRRKEVFKRLGNLSLPAAVRNALIPPGVTGSGGIHEDEDSVLEEEQPSLPAKQTEIVRTAAEPESRLENNDEEPSKIEATGLPNKAEGPIPNPPSNNEKTSEEKNTDAQQNLIASPSGRFLPNAEWLEKVKADLPVNTVMRLITYMVPQVEELCHNSSAAIDDETLMDFIKSTTMVGLLPVPHPIVIRKYQPNHYTALWFTAYMWGVIFLRNQGLPIFDGEAIKLFHVSVS